MLSDALRRGRLWVRRYVFWILSILVLLLAIFLLSVYAEKLPDWTGFPEYDAGGGRLIRPKTLWDWLDLVIVSTVVALGLFWLNRTQRDRDALREKDRQHQDTLSNYFDRMSELILKEGLGSDAGNQEGEGSKNVEDIVSKKRAATIARARTLATLRSLDADSIRVADVFRFLSETDLAATVLLADGDLQRVDWSEANLRGANLNRVNLSRANLSGADLRGARLQRATLNNADLSHAKLNGADLSNAFLQGADLTGATMRTVLAEEDRDAFRAALKRGEVLRAQNLPESTVRAAELGPATLDGADLRKAKYDDNTMWPKGFRPKDAGAVLVEPD